MKRGEATGAIVGARLRKQLVFALSAVAGCGLAGALLAAAHICSGAVLFGGLCGIGAALLTRDPAASDLELCEQSAPLYGRELARARAGVPCAIVTAALLAYWLCALSAAIPRPECVALSLAVCYAATVTALCATVRQGRSAALYVTLGALLAAAAVFVQSAAWQIVVSATLIYAAIGFAALRQYGEALARYDPI